MKQRFIVGVKGKKHQIFRFHILRASVSRAEFRVFLSIFFPFVRADKIHLPGIKKTKQKTSKQLKRDSSCGSVFWQVLFKDPQRSRCPFGNKLINDQRWVWKLFPARQDVWISFFSSLVLPIVLTGLVPCLDSRLFCQCCVENLHMPFVTFPQTCFYFKGVFIDNLFPRE